MNKVILNTSGDSLWSQKLRKAVTITDIQLEKAYCWLDDEDPDLGGELRVYFDTKTWNVERDGLIYTDNGFERELQQFLDAHGLPGDNVWYSEQGMQGDDYVSLDAGHEFYMAWMKKFNRKLDEMVVFVS
jgi:hypothetical protein